MFRKRYNLVFIRLSDLNNSCLILFKNGTFLFRIRQIFQFVKFLTFREIFNAKIF